MKSDFSAISNDRLSLMRHKMALAIREAERAGSDISSLEAAYESLCVELRQRRVFA